MNVRRERQFVLNTTYDLDTWLASHSDHL